MPRRMGRPGLIGTMARTAVIAGTATAVSGSVSRSQAAKANAQQVEAQQAAESQAQLAEMQAQLAAMQAQQAPAAAPAAPAGDLMSELTKLAELHSAGILTDAEFAAAKAKLLG
jgi:Short C-terminal domain